MLLQHNGSQRNFLKKYSYLEKLFLQVFFLNLHNISARFYLPSLYIVDVDHLNLDKGCQSIIKFFEYINKFLNKNCIQ